jgi:DNA-binding NarL/FixJ family response regulator
MTSQSTATLNLMLVEDDAAFRQGLITSLDAYPDLQIALEADSGEAAIAQLVQWFEEGRSLDLILLSLDLRDVNGANIGLSLCQQLNAQYPQIPILLLSTLPDPAVLAAALQTTAMGYCQKNTATREIVLIIRQIAAGYPNWTQGMRSITQALTQPTVPNPNPVALSPPPLTALDVMRRNMRLSGMQQIDAAIAETNAQLSRTNLSVLDQLFFTGRRRELQTARWVVNRLLTSESERFADRLTALSESVPQPNQPANARFVTRSRSFPQNSLRESQPPLPSNLAAPAITLTPYTKISVDTASANNLRSIQASLFDNTFAKLQGDLHNLTAYPLEIDILNDDKKHELLAIVLRQLEDILNDLRFSNLELAQLSERRSTVLCDLWQAVTSDFFGRYTTLNLSNSPIGQLQPPTVDVVEVLLLDVDVVQANILDKIPAVTDFLAHLLFQTPLLIDNTTHAVGSVEAMARLETLLQNLMIQVANAVMQPLLNRFGDAIAIKQNFYDRRLLSIREIERFRNNLSWKYRVERLVGEPTAIFESRHTLFILEDQGITQTSIYAPRNQELADLTGVRLAVTLTLETRDAIAPRLQSAVSFVGSGVVYVLTEVIGRGIGLIGRGIIKGIGNALQDTRFSRR